MEEYTRDRRIKQVRKMLSLMNVSQQEVENFDALVADLDLTVADATGWEEDLFFNPQEHNDKPHK